MTLTVLIDLDDTLLNNNVDIFIPTYLKTLGKHLEKRVAPDKLISSLLSATRAMQLNEYPGISLEEAFDQVFYPAIGQRKNELRPLIEQYYDDIFPGLSTLTSRRPEAPEVVQEIIKKGHHLIIATNPLFPRKAILHRLRWAGLDPDLVNFALITTYEKFHFAKPNPAYYAEILAQMSFPKQPAVMVGNSLQDDLAPAKQIGMPVFWVVQAPSQLPAGFHPMSSYGNLDELPIWLEKVDNAGLEQEYNSPTGMLAMLRSAPAAFDALRHDLTSELFRSRPEPGEWSLTEIFCHLRDVDQDVNIPRFHKIINEENPFLAGIDTDPWAEKRAYHKSDGLTALRDLVDVRMKMISILTALNKEAWLRPARHAIFGPTNLAELVKFVTIHDQTHVQQAYATYQRIVHRNAPS